MKNLDVRETYLYKLHLITNKLDAFFDGVLRKHAGIGLTQFLFLQSVRQSQPVRQGRVAELLMLTPAAVSRQVEVAKSKGWITTIRYDEDADRRVQVVTITDKGKERLQSGLEALERYAFYIFKDQDNPHSLMEHIDTLLANMKGEKQ